MPHLNFENNVPALFHPTTLMLIDDNNFFLQAFEMFLVDQRPAVKFDLPQSAIKHLAQYTQPLNSCAFLNEAEKLKAYLNSHDRFKFSAVIMSDYHMPGMNGDILLEQLRSELCYPFIGIILTGNANPEILEKLNKNPNINTIFTKNDLANHVTNFPDLLRQDEKKFFSKQFYCTHAPITSDPTFVTLFNQLVKGLLIIEGYLLNEKGDYLLIDIKGCIYKFNAPSETDLNDLEKIDATDLQTLCTPMPDWKATLFEDYMSHY